MKTYRFRGKRVDNRKFTYGDLIQLNDGRKYIVDNRFGACIDNKGNFINTESPFVNQVIPETVGQFTGESDKNNKEVYEGDIVKYGLLYYDNSIQLCIGNVMFENCSFAIKNNAKNVNNCYLHQTIDYGEKLEVIGNIHDNRELLK